MLNLDLQLPKKEKIVRSIYIKESSWKNILNIAKYFGLSASSLIEKMGEKIKIEDFNIIEDDNNNVNNTINN